MTELIFDVHDMKEFEEKVLNNNSVIVDFHASWCNPCRVLGPKLEKAVQKRSGSVALAKVDITQNEDVAQKYSVTSIPKVIGMCGGVIISEFVGLRNDDFLDEFIDNFISETKKLSQTQFKKM